MSEQPKKTSDELAQERTDLALQRTVKPPPSAP